MAKPLKEPEYPRHEANTADRPTDPFAGSAWRRFLFGVSLPWQGLRFLLARPRLLGLIVGPAVINTALLLIALFAAVLFGPGLLGLVWSRPEAQGFWGVCLGGLWLGTAALVVLLLTVAGFVCVYGLAGLVLTPFLDYLTERVEASILGPRYDRFRWGLFVRQVGISIAHSLLNLLLYLLVMGPLLLLNLIPVAGQVLFMMASGSATAFFLGREMLDGPLTRDGYTWRGKLKLVWRRRAEAAGLGLATMALLWLPLFNFVCLPVAVTGGTLLYCRLRREGHLPGPAALKTNFTQGRQATEGRAGRRE